jgi:hypothetical protein
MKATELGLNTGPPPLTGVDVDGNKVASMDKGPAGEEIKLSTKGQFFYHPVGDITKSVIVKAKVNQKGEAIIVQQDSNPPAGLVLISDMFTYNRGGEFINNIAEDPGEVNAVSDEALSSDEIPTGLNMQTPMPIEHY